MSLFPPSEVVTSSESSSSSDSFVGIDIGCGPNKRENFFGVDIAPANGVDHVIDFEKDRLPFDDNSVDHVFSNHAFEHIHSPQHILREIVRVCKHDALVEIWTPYLKSNDAFLLGHFSFYNEAIWKHICYEYDGFYFEDAPGRFDWKETRYVLSPIILDKLKANGVQFEFALEHMFNIAMEFGVYIRVDKNVRKAKAPQYPVISAGYNRASIDMTLEQMNLHTQRG